jgi:hypothetical protein
MVAALTVEPGRGRTADKRRFLASRTCDALQWRILPDRKKGDGMRKTIVPLAAAALLMLGAFPAHASTIQHYQVTATGELENGLQCQTCYHVAVSFDLVCQPSTTGYTVRSWIIQDGQKFVDPVDRSAPSCGGPGTHNIHNPHFSQTPPGGFHTGPARVTSRITLTTGEIINYGRDITVVDNCTPPPGTDWEC